MHTCPLGIKNSISPIFLNPIEIYLLTYASSRYLVHKSLLELTFSVAVISPKKVPNSFVFLV